MKITEPDNQHELKDILSLLMVECDIDDAQLARETGIPASTISRLRINSSANPTASTLRPLAKFFGVSISQLLGDEPLAVDRLPGTHNPTAYTVARMPVLEWNSVLDWIQNRCADSKERLQTWISTEKIVGPDAFALRIPSDSFGLAFRKGSTVIIDPASSPTDGDLVLIKSENNIVLKQFLTDGHEIYIKSVNPEIKSIVPLAEIHTVIGIVIETRFSLQSSSSQKSLKSDVPLFDLTKLAAQLIL